MVQPEARAAENRTCWGVAFNELPTACHQSSPGSGKRNSAMMGIPWILGPKMRRLYRCRYSQFLTRFGDPSLNFFAGRRDEHRVITWRAVVRNTPEGANVDFAGFNLTINFSDMIV